MASSTIHKSEHLFFKDIEVTGIAISNEDGAGYASDAINIPDIPSNAVPIGCFFYGHGASAGVIPMVFGRTSLILTCHKTFTMASGATRVVRIVYRYL